MNEIMPHEPQVFARYLGARSTDEALIKQYRQAVEVLQVSLSDADKRLLQKLVSMPFLLPFIDGALALRKPDHPVRERILIMSALMETDKKYIAHFLVEKNFSFPILRFLYRGSVAVLKGGVGLILFPFLKWS